MGGPFDPLPLCTFEPSKVVKYWPHPLSPSMFEQMDLTNTQPLRGQTANIDNDLQLYILKYLCYSQFQCLIQSAQR